MWRKVYVVIRVLVICYVIEIILLVNYDVNFVRKKKKFCFFYGVKCLNMGVVECNLIIKKYYWKKNLVVVVR